MLTKNSESSDCEELLESAREKYEARDISQAERILNQVILFNNRIPEAFYLLANIYYDQGKFSKSIKSYKRSLEIDPGYADASIGLSMLLNDMGKYEEGRQVFEAAEKVAKEKSQLKDPYVESRLIARHRELAEMYFQFGNFDEAIEQFKKMLRLIEEKSQRTEISMRIVDCLSEKGDATGALRELRSITRENPSYLPARTKTGVLLYNSGHVADAVEQWEGVLLRDPQNPEALKHLQFAQKSHFKDLT